MPAGFADYSLDQSGVLNVVNGGTGQAALTQNGVLIGNAGGAINSTAAGTARQNFQVAAGGGVPGFQAPDFATVDVTPPADNQGVVLHGSTSPPIAPAYVFRDDTAAVIRGRLGLASWAPAFDSNSQAGDIVLQATTGTLRLQANSGASAFWVTPANVGITGIVGAYNGRATAGQGVPSIVASVAKAVSGTTSYSETLLASEPGFSVYRVSGYIVQTTAGGSGNASMSVTYNNGSASRTITFAPAVATGSAGVDTQGSIVIRANQSTAVTVTVTTNNVAPFVYDLALERLI